MSTMPLYSRCRIAVTQRAVAHVSIPVDVQEQRLEEAEPSSTQRRASRIFA